ncbi:MAG: hypothetical protein JW900_10070 [Anaerolineae bacterium]|nr:hypothetical protein [Anaerolineae bacterium]
MTTVKTIQRRDRWADAAVIGLVIVALAVGLLLRNGVLSRTVAFTADTITGAYPVDWIRESSENHLLRVHDPRGGEFNTVLELYSRPLAAEAEVAMVLDALAMERVGQVSNYRTLETDQVALDGNTATRRLFTYVYVDPNPFVDRLPVVVQGMDLALRDGGRVIVATLLAEADEFDAQQGRFLDFVQSLEF